MMLHLEVVIAAGVRSVSMTKEIVTALKMMPMFETVALPSSLSSSTARKARSHRRKCRKKPRQ